MRSMQNFVGDALVTGAVAGVATTVAAAACGKIEGKTAAAPINAVSHIVWGDEAATVDEVDPAHTLTGIALNSAAVLSWAALHELLLGEEKNAAKSLLGGVAVAALAYVTDYYVVPDRLTPGFEKRLSNGSLFGIYATLALSLGIGGILGRSPAGDAR